MCGFDGLEALGENDTFFTLLCFVVRGKNGRGLEMADEDGAPP
jgi:hypothetical protein